MRRMLTVVVAPVLVVWGAVAATSAATSSRNNAILNSNSPRPLPFSGTTTTTLPPTTTTTLPPTTTTPATTTTTTTLPTTTTSTTVPSSCAIANPVHGVLATLTDVGDSPAWMATSPSGSQVYVVLNSYSGTSTLRVIDTSTNETWPIDVGVNAQFPAVTPDGSRVYVPNVGGSSVSVIDTATKSVTATIPVAATPTWVAANSTAAFVAHNNFGSTLISVILHSDNSVTTFDPGFQVRGFAMSSDGSKLYASGQSGTVWVIDTATKASTMLLDLGAGTFPESVELSPDGSTLYVGGSFTNLYVIDASSGTLTATVAVAYTTDVAVSPDGAFVYAVNQNANSLSVIDTTTNSVVETVTVGATPFGVAVSDDGSLVFVSNYVGDSLTVISPCTSP